MESAILRHSTRKLWLHAGLGMIFVLVVIWLEMSGGIGSDLHGRGAGLVAFLGPTGTHVFFAAFGVACALAMVLSLRLLVPHDRQAALADTAGVTIRTLFGTKRYAWNEIADLRVQSVSAGWQTQHMLVLKGNGRRGTTLPAGTVDGGKSALHGWLETAAALHRQASAC